MKNLVLILLTALPFLGMSQGKHRTQLKDSKLKFKNKESVWYVVYHGDTVGEFWPVWNVNLITNQTDPQLFSPNKKLEDIHRSLRSAAITPDGMTKGSTPALMEGKSLANGIPVGDGVVYDYGIIITHKNKTDGLVFTHKREIRDFQNQYDKIKNNGGTMFFLPSIMRNGNVHPSTTKKVDRVLINRITPDKDSRPLKGRQQGVIVFYDDHTYPEVVDIVTGLDRKYRNGSTRSETRHIYVLDGGPSYGAVAREELDGTVTVIGTRTSGLNTNYLAWF
jgi:hypothetical protein